MATGWNAVAAALSVRTGNPCRPSADRCRQRHVRNEVARGCIHVDDARGRRADGTDDRTALARASRMP